MPPPNRSIFSAFRLTDILPATPVSRLFHRPAETKQTEPQQNSRRLQEVQNVMNAASSSGNYGGVTSWYKCPNGHMYGVGDCGLLNGYGACVECGARVGGSATH